MHNQITPEDVKDIQQLLRFDEKTPLIKMVEITNKMQELVIDILTEKNDETITKFSKIEIGMQPKVAELVAKTCGQKANCEITAELLKSYGYTAVIRINFIGHPLFVKLAFDCYVAIGRVLNWNYQSHIKNITPSLHKRCIDYLDELALSYYFFYKSFFDVVDFRYEAKRWEKVEDIEPCFELLNNINTDSINKKVINELIELKKNNNCGSIVSVNPEKYGFMNYIPHHVRLLRFCANLFDCELTGIEHAHMHNVQISSYQEKIDATIMTYQTLCDFVNKKANRFFSILKKSGWCAIDSSELLQGVLEIALKKHIANIVMAKLDSAVRFKGMK
ncbi:MAG: hypothetical protein M3Z51_00040 [Snodgrassella alvi]|nr:hypothetical protein [Snodgrassella alvi]